MFHLLDPLHFEYQQEKIKASVLFHEFFRLIKPPGNFLFYFHFGTEQERGTPCIDHYHALHYLQRHGEDGLFPAEDTLWPSKQIPMLEISA